MIQVGASGGSFGALAGSPTSSNTITSTYSQLAALALGFSPKRSMMKLAVLPYQASPSLRLWLGKNAGHVALIAPSA